MSGPEFKVTKVDFPSVVGYQDSMITPIKKVRFIPRRESKPVVPEVSKPIQPQEKTSNQ